VTPVPESLLRELAPQVLGAVVRRFRDFAAATQWPRDGLPANPRGWLIHVAARRLTDEIRAEIARRRREAIVMLEMTPEAAPPPDAVSPLHQDDTLNLLVMCCHPALTRPSAIALTLRAVGGLTTAEIARAFLVPETTMAQRISRAKATIKASGIPFAPPSPGELNQRLDAVLHVLYLVFNEGYSTSAGPVLQRADLANEAIRLARELHAALPDHAETMGLLALLLLTDARRAARVGPAGELIPLDQQDRRLWDAAAIAEGVALVSDALPRGAVGPYQLQAAIAAVHDEAARVEDTDWPQILALYGVLERLSDNPMVRLSRVVAQAMVQGPAAGLAALAPLDVKGALAGHHRLHSVRAHLLERAGDRMAAAEHYRIAAGKTASIPEQRYLLTRAATLDGGQ
jgi:predicted RNA polymerase sigma factor